MDLIPGGQDSSRRQTVFFLPVDPRDQSHKDPEKIDFSVPRLARYLHSAWKRHQDAVFWVDVDFAIRKGLTFYLTRSNAIILQGTLPAYCIPKDVRLKTGDVLYEKAYLSPRPPPKISLKHDHNWTKGNDQSGSTVNWRGKHRLQHLRRAERDGETITWRQRSKFDSEDQKSPSTKSTSKWSSTTSSIQSLQRKADVRFSVLRPHCLEVNSKAKDVENCRFTLLPLIKQLKLFFA